MYSLTFCIRFLLPGFALCCHSNAPRTPTANPSNSAQLGGSLYHAPKLHPGPCSSVGVRPRTDRQTHIQTDTQTRMTTIHFASSMTQAKCNKTVTLVKHHYKESFDKATTDVNAHSAQMQVQNVTMTAIHSTEITDSTVFMH